ncbi:MAG: AAA family ATPase [Bacillota bacterium]
MKLREFKTEIFAGINNRSYKFENGLNIILGANEAGKSTLINAIYASLFINPQIKLNTTEGKEFQKYYFPYPDGDYAEAELKFEIEAQTYKIYKKWSNNNYSGYLELSDGRRIEKTNKIAAYKKDLFPYAKSTYNNIVFSSQEDIKSTLARINSEQNPELINTINSFLRKAVMELDGVSIDKFRQKLNENLTELTKRWKLKADTISNSARGVNNPYQVGTGKIYDLFIAKEKLRLKIKESKINEKEYEKISSEIRKLKEEEQKLIKDIEKLAKIEAEINQRVEIELKLANKRERIESLEKIKEKWPQLEQQLAELQSTKQAQELKLQKLEAEKQRSQKLSQKEELEVKIKKIKQLKSEKLKQKEILAKINFTKKDLEKLEKAKNKIAQNKASLKASKLKAKINFSESDKIKVTAGVDREKTVPKDQIIEADGYLKIKTDQIEIEIESAEINFASLKEELSSYQKEFLNLKRKMKVSDLKEAKQKLAKKDEAARELNRQNTELRELLAGANLDSLENNLAQLAKVKAAREIEIIDKEIEKIKDDLANLKTEIKIRENKKEEWKIDYQNLTNLKLKLAEQVEAKINLAKKLEQLASLPAQYESSQEFVTSLQAKREEREKINQNLRLKIEKYKELENLLPVESTPEMENKLENLKEKLEKAKTRASKLVKIKEVFEKKLKEMDQNSFRPLTKSFSKNLEILTAGKYEQGIIEDDFSIQIQTNKNKKLPGKLELLSYGTYDAAALALRFAIFDNLFKQTGGFIILDDCLVNLDPKRRKNAIKLINQYQKKYQILYTTCEPERAAELNGNIIKI